MKNRLLTDCVCDLSNEMMESIDVGVVRFYLHLDTGTFMDRYEISADNVIEYYEGNGSKIISVEPTAEEYSKIFRNELRNYDNVIHFSISSKISESYDNACNGRSMLEPELAKHVFVIDTLSLSGAMALLLFRASSMKQSGATAEEIVQEMNDMIPRINTNFITPNADYLVINERVEAWVSSFCKSLRLRPAFKMYDGELKPSRFEYGSREGYIRRYIKHEMKHPERIDVENVFIVHSSSTKEELEYMKEIVLSIVPFKNVYTTKTSATVTCNCGEGAVGVEFVYKK